MQYSKFKSILKWLSKISFLLSFIALIGIIIDYGVFQSETFEQKLFWLYLTTIEVAFITTVFRFFQQKNNTNFNF